MNKRLSAMLVLVAVTLLGCDGAPGGKPPVSPRDVELPERSYCEDLTICGI